MVFLRNTSSLSLSLCVWIVHQTGQAICQISWQDLLARFPDSNYRAQRACFGAAYIYFFMTDVYGISELSQGRVIQWIDWSVYD